MRPVLAPDANVRHRPLLLAQIEKYVHVHTGYKGLEVTPRGILCEDSEGKQVLVEGDTVICALGQRSRTDVVDALRDSAPFVRVIGDAGKVSTITNAVYQGTGLRWIYKNKELRKRFAALCFCFWSMEAGFRRRSTPLARRAIFVIKNNTPRNGSGLFFSPLQQNILQHEQHGQHIHQPADLLGPARQQVQYHVGDDTEGDPFGDAVAKGMAMMAM